MGNELQAQALQGNILNPAAYQYAGRQLGGDFQLAQAYDPNSAQFVPSALQQLDLSQQQMYSQLPNQQQAQFLQVARNSKTNLTIAVNTNLVVLTLDTFSGCSILLIKGSDCITYSGLCSLMSFRQIQLSFLYSFLTYLCN